MIPFVDLEAQHAAIAGEVEEAALRVIRSGSYILGEPVESFERNFAHYCETTEAVAVNSGTSALHLALLALGIGPGDEVITTPLTFVATAAAIEYCGARPIFVDVDPESCTIDPARIESAVTARTKAILPVHLYGHPADLNAILGVAAKRNLAVVEDAAQAHGARCDGRRVGGIGRLGCFSFYPAKNLGAAGEGGAVVTSDRTLARTIRMLRDWGQERKGEHRLKSFNYRMEALQGAILGVKLRHLDRWNERRRQLAGLYDRLLDPRIPRLSRQLDGRQHVFHIYAIRVKDRERVRADLTNRGIHTGVHYERPVHLQPAYVNLGYGAGDFPIAEAIATETLSLPMFAELSEGHVLEVVQQVHDVLGFS